MLVLLTCPYQLYSSMLTTLVAFKTTCYLKKKKKKAAQMLLQQIVKVKKKKKRSLSKLRPVALFSSRLHNSSVSLRGIDVVRTFGGVAREGSGGGCGQKAKLVRTPTFFCTRALEKARARPPAQPPDLNFGTPRAYDLLIMNLNPLF